MGNGWGCHPKGWIVKAKMDCIEVRHWMDCWIDGELDVDTASEAMRLHVQQCHSCRAEFEMRQRCRLNLQQAHAQIVIPESLRRRCLSTLYKNHRDGTGGEVPEQRHQRALALMPNAAHISILDRRPWTWAAVAAMLAAAVVWGVRQERFLNPTRSLDADWVAMARQHERLPMDVQTTAYDDVESLHQYFKPRLSFPVRLPRPKTLPVHFVGGRVTRIQNRDAAYLRMQSPRGAVSMLVYPSQRNEALTESQNMSQAVSMQPAHDISPSALQFAETREGYTVARWRNQGVVYSAVARLPVKELQEVLQALQQEP